MDRQVTDTIATAEKIVLHVGCGEWRPNALYPDYQKPGWREIRLDINPDAKPDIVASMTDMSPVESNSADAIWHSHALEHLAHHEVPVALSEFYRVLRPGGHVFMRMPDVETAAELILKVGLHAVAYESPAGPVTPRDLLYGHWRMAADDPWMQHKTGFTRETLSAALLEAGFTNVKVLRDHFDLWARAVKQAPQGASDL